MTRRQLYNAILIELNKNQAPTLLIEDYNYYIMKAIYKVIDLKYSYNSINQKIDDDLKSISEPYIITDKTKITTYGAGKDIYQFVLPDNYLHLQNCIAVYKYTSPYGCNKTNDLISYGCIRMTSMMEPVFSLNYYFKPKWDKPYALLNKPSGTTKTANAQNTPDEVPVDNQIRNNVIKTGIEVHVGKIPSYLTLDSIQGRYYRIPENVYLTQDDLDSEFDNTPYLEYPDYLCYEIISALVTLFLEHDSNPRLQSNMIVSSNHAENNANR